MRKRARTDANQKNIVSDLRKVGYSVVSLASIGNGVPDILVGIRNQNYLFELKDPAQPPSKRKLTDDEKKFFRNWKGQVEVVETTEEIIEIIAEAS